MLAGQSSKADELSDSFELGELGFPNYVNLIELSDFTKRSRVDLTFTPTWASTAGRLVGGSFVNRETNETCLKVTSIRTGKTVSDCPKLAELIRFAYMDDLSRLAMIGRMTFRGKCQLIIDDRITGVRTVPVKLAEKTLTATGPSWSVDGQMLALEWNEEIIIIRGDQKIGVFQGTRGRISPDGRWLAYQPSPGTVGVMEIGSGRLIWSVDAVERCRPMWSPDSRYVLYSRRSIVPWLVSAVLTIASASNGVEVWRQSISGPSTGENYFLVPRSGG